MKNKTLHHLPYTDGVFGALFTAVSNQIGAVFSVQELHLSLVSLHGPCKPEPPVNNYCTYTAINHSEHEDENNQNNQYFQSKTDFRLPLAIYSHLLSSLTRAGPSNQQVLEPGTEKNLGYFVS